MNTKIDLLVLPTVSGIDEIIDGLSMPIELTKGSYKKLEFRFVNNEVTIIHDGIDIKDFTNVWLSSFWTSRDLAYATNLYLEHFNTPHTYVEEGTSKITDQVRFALNNIVIPDTFFINSPDISTHIETIEEICGYPLIIKNIIGHGGKNSALVNNRKELVEKAKILTTKGKCFFQRFVSNDYEWGVIIANGKVVSAEKSYPTEGEFRNNVCNGGTEEFVNICDIPKEICDIAIKAGEILGLSWSRSDIIIDKETGTPYLMEVNRYPGITSGTIEVTAAQTFLESHINMTV